MVEADVSIRGALYAGGRRGGHGGIFEFYFISDYDRVKPFQLKSVLVRQKSPQCHLHTLSRPQSSVGGFGRHLEDRLHGGQGGSLVPPHTGHADASPSLSLGGPTAAAAGTAGTGGSQHAAAHPCMTRLASGHRLTRL